MPLNSIEAKKASRRGFSADTEGERWQYPSEICILALPLTPSSSSRTAVLRTCKFLAFQVSSAPWPCALHMERWREVVVLGNAEVYVLILPLIVPQYGACPCPLMQWVGRKVVRQHCAVTAPPLAASLYSCTALLQLQSRNRWPGKICHVFTTENNWKQQGTRRYNV